MNNGSGGAGSLSADEQYQIFPAIGVARVGQDTAEYYVAPSAPDLTFSPLGGHRDANGLVKRMGCEFRVYKFNTSGNGAQEITLATAQSIEWRVQLVNKKAEYIPPGGTALNANPAGSLTVDTGVVTLNGGSLTAPLTGDILIGTPEQRTMHLGDMETDADGRLTVIGGKGEAYNFDASGTATDIRNPGWIDDVSDGIVEATVTFANSSVMAISSRIIIGPPDYAHACNAIVTLMDLALDKGGTFPAQGRKETPPSFTKDIYPVLHRTAFMEWTLYSTKSGKYGRAAKHGHGYTGSRDDMHPEGMFLNPIIFDPIQYTGKPTDTGTPTEPEFDAAEYEKASQLRTKMFRQLKRPEGDGAETGIWYPFTVMGTDDKTKRFLSGNMPPIQGLSLTSRQYWQFEHFAGGSFIGDWPMGLLPDLPLQPAFSTIADIEQPEAMNRASLDFAVGGPFSPGWEAGAALSQSDSYAVISGVAPEIGFRVDAAIAPGDLTADLSLPWQCGMNRHNLLGEETSIHDNDNLWPSARPVLMQVDDGTGVYTPEMWIRPFAPAAGDLQELQQMTTNMEMIANWGDLGFLGPAPSFDPAAPDFVEIDRL